MIFSPPKEAILCAPQPTAKTACPHCKRYGNKVGAVTIKSQLHKALQKTMRLSMDAFNFCSDPECDTVYYCDDGSETFGQKDIKSKVTLKNDDPKTPLCYCHKLLKEDLLAMIAHKEANIVHNIKTIISNGKSFCEKSNPKGTCCTTDIKGVLKDHGIVWEEPKKSAFSMIPPSSSCSSGCC